MATDSQPNGAGRQQQVLATFTHVADSYDEVGFLRRTAERLVHHAGLSPGDRVLDLATGTGWAALAAASAVGPSGHVLGTDQAEPMLARARVKAGEAGLSNIDFTQGDAEHPDAPAHPLDVVLCASAMHFLGDPVAVLRRWRELLSSGGRVAFSSWAEPFGGAPMALFQQQLDARGVAGLSRTFLSAAQHNVALLEAGFEAIETHEERLDDMLPTAEAWWQRVETGAHGRSLDQLPPQERDALCTQILDDLAKYREADGIRWDVHAVFASGVAP